MKLLIVKLHALGDLVIITPAIKRLRDGFPEAQIDLLTTDWSAPAIVSNPYIDNIIIEKISTFFDPGFSTLIPTLKVIRKLRLQNYDAAIAFHSNKKIHNFVTAIGIRDKFVFKSGRSAGDFLNNDKFSVPLDEERHSALTAWELSNCAVKRMGGKLDHPVVLDDLRYDWYIQDSERLRASKILSEAGLDSQNFVVVLPGGGVNPNTKEMVRRWDSKRFGDLSVEIKEVLGTPIVLMGGKIDNDVCQDVEKHISKVHSKDEWGNKNHKPINWAGEHNLRLASAIMAEAKLVITNDTGPLHIAGALGVPTIGIFGPTGYRLKLPPGDHCFSANSNLPCSPCYFGSFKRCIFESIRCMDELKVSDVMKVVKKALDFTRKSTSDQKEIEEIC